MSRLISATVTSPDETPREGLRIDFHGHDGSHVTATTDAGGVFTAPLEVGVTYDIPTENPAYVEGVAFPAGTMFRLTVPEGDGPIQIVGGAVGVIDMSRSSIARRLEAIEAALDLPSPQPVPAPEPPPATRPRPAVVTS